MIKLSSHLLLVFLLLAQIICSEAANKNKKKLNRDVNDRKELLISELLKKYSTYELPMKLANIEAYYLYDLVKQVCEETHLVYQHGKRKRFPNYWLDIRKVNDNEILTAILKPQPEVTGYEQEKEAELAKFLELFDKEWFYSNKSYKFKKSPTENQTRQADAIRKQKQGEIKELDSKATLMDYISTLAKILKLYKMVLVLIAKQNSKSTNKTSEYESMEDLVKEYKNGAVYKKFFQHVYGEYKSIEKEKHEKMLQTFLYEKVPKIPNMKAKEFYAEVEKVHGIRHESYSGSLSKYWFDLNKSNKPSLFDSILKKDAEEIQPEKENIFENCTKMFKKNIKTISTILKLYKVALYLLAKNYESTSAESDRQLLDFYLKLWKNYENVEKEKERIVNKQKSDIILQSFRFQPLPDVNNMSAENFYLVVKGICGKNEINSVSTYWLDLSQIKDWKTSKMVTALLSFPTGIYQQEIQSEQDVKELEYKNLLLKISKLYEVVLTLLAQEKQSFKDRIWPNDGGHVNLVLHAYEEYKKVEKEIEKNKHKDIND